MRKAELVWWLELAPPGGSASPAPTVPAADGLRAAACPSPGLGGPNRSPLLGESLATFAAGPPAPRVAPSRSAGHAVVSLESHHAANGPGCWFCL